MSITKDGRVSLAYKGLYEIPILDFGKKCDQIKHLDLSHNNLM
jgi:hypothetical protein